MKDTAATADDTGQVYEDEEGAVLLLLDSLDVIIAHTQVPAVLHDGHRYWGPTADDTGQVDEDEEGAVLLLLDSLDVIIAHTKFLHSYMTGIATEVIKSLKIVTSWFPGVATVHQKQFDLYIMT
jgi:hypothetical protein